MLKLVPHNPASDLLLTRWMRPLLMFLVICGVAQAADDNLLNLAIRAQTDFDRTELAVTPKVPETLACVQSQAMVLPVTRPGELSLIYYRKGYCELLGATVSHDRSGFRDAARDFEKAAESWPERTKKGTAIPPVPSGLRILLASSHLLADGNTDPRVTHDLEDAVNQAECPNSVMSTTRCHDLIDVGKLWLGWVAGREGRLADAASWFQTFGGTGWPALVAGRQAMTRHNYPEAVADFEKAVERFSQGLTHGLGGRIGPRPDLADAAFRLGTAQFEAKQYQPAVVSLDEAVKLRPENARAVFVRGRAKEILGQSGVADYDLASRTAFANVNAPGASGQAHLYRGIALYRRKDYARAEQEFSSALNFDAGPDGRDATAWRHMAAVAGGACGSSAAMLQEAVGQASSYFPKNEAETLVKNCPAAQLSEVVEPSAH